MQERKSVNYKGLRKSVSKLFYAVLTKRMRVQDALARFPKDCEDKTITASWHALCHLEADEDIRAKDKLYADEQDEYIEFIANILAKGESLPDNITNAYIPYHNEALIPNSNKVKGIWAELKRFLCC